MKAYFFAILLLALGAIGSAFTGIWAFSQYRAAVSANDESQQSLDQKKQQQQQVIADLAKRRQEVTDARQYVESWADAIGRTQNLAGMISGLDGAAQAHLVALSDKRTPEEKIAWKGAQESVQAVSLTASGDYYRLINWLGAVEATYPSALLHRLSMEQDNQTLKLSLTLYVPQFIKP